MFQRLGLINYGIATGHTDKMLDLAIEAGASDCQSSDEGHDIYCALEDLHMVREYLEAQVGEALAVKLIWKPTITSTPTHDQIKNILKLIDLLEDLDDVQNVWTNLEIPEDFADE
jgi:transcriptional/translational regulatory protein YebC/TACO1